MRQDRGRRHPTGVLPYHTAARPGNAPAAARPEGEMMPVAPSRLLVIRRDNIGDLVCTTPLLHALRAAFPAARLCALVNSYNAAVLAANPDVDAVYAYTKRKHGSSGLWALARERFRLRRALRRERFNCVIVAGADPGARALRRARALRPDHIIGLAPPGTRSAIDLPVTPAPAPLHEVEATFRLLAPLGIAGTPPPVRVFADATLADAVRRRIAQAHWPRNTPLVGVHISARKPSNRWPTARFAELMRTLHAHHGAAFLLLWAPGPADDPRHPGDDAQATAVLHLAGEVPVLACTTHELAELIAALSVCEAVVCSDGGAMHLAAALAKPIVCLFGDSDAHRWRPWGVPHVLLQPESLDVADVSVAEVTEAFAKLGRA